MRLSEYSAEELSWLLGSASAATTGHSIDSTDRIGVVGTPGVRPTLSHPIGGSVGVRVLAVSSDRGRTDQ